LNQLTIEATSPEVELLESALLLATVVGKAIKSFDIAIGVALVSVADGGGVNDALVNGSIGDISGIGPIGGVPAGAID